MAKRKAKPKYRVFVSHATADKWVARMICEKIEAVGAATFRDDRDIEGGDAIPRILRDELLDSDEFLLLLTPTSANRPWVTIEIGAAWAKDMRIVPICYQCSAEMIPATIRDNKAFDLNDLDRYLVELVGRIAGRTP